MFYKFIGIWLVLVCFTLSLVLLFGGGVTAIVCHVLTKNAWYELFWIVEFCLFPIGMVCTKFFIDAAIEDAAEIKANEEKKQKQV